MASAELEAGAVVSREVEALPARRARVVLRVAVGAVVACSLLGLLAWNCAAGALESVPTTPQTPTPALAYVPAGMVPFRQPLPAVQRHALPAMQQIDTPGTADIRGGTAPGAERTSVGGIRSTSVGVQKPPLKAIGSEFTPPERMRDEKDTILVQGGALRTWAYRSSAVERVEVVLSTEGRPLDADIELWNGPGNTPAKMRVYVEDGFRNPFTTTIETPRGSNTVAIRNIGQLEFPMAAQVFADDVVIPSPECESTRVVIQGGALRTYPFDPAVESVEVLLTTDGRPLNARIELLQGPNNNKQVIELYAEDGLERPFFCILETPGPGNVVRVVNTAPIEFPMSASIIPHSINPNAHSYADLGGPGDVVIGGELGRY